jgi:hypothetical protein
MSRRRHLSKLHFLLRHRPDDLQREIRTHLAMEEAENAAAGMGARKLDIGRSGASGI